MLEKGKKLLAKLMIIGAISGQFLSVSSLATSVAQSPGIKSTKVNKQANNKRKKRSKKQIKALLKRKMAVYATKANAHKNAVNRRKRRAQAYKVRFSKAKTKKGKHKLLKARNRMIKMIRLHTRKMRHFRAKANNLKKRLGLVKKPKTVMLGRASWYSLPGRRTANGEIFKPGAMTAAMRGFRGRRVKVVNMSNKKSVMVRINDHGPARYTGRVIDLSVGSFAKIASTRQGVIPRVKVYVY